MAKVSDIYGSMVFNEHTMQERLPSATYKSLLRTIKEGEPLDIEVANVVAHAMKEWAIEKGATHYTHWFQPLSGITSEKHDSFLDPCGDGRAIMSFSGKELIQGEPDASQLPLRRPARHLRGPRLHRVGPHQPTPSSRTRCCASPPPSAATPARRSTRRRRSCAPWSAVEEQANRVLALFGEHAPARRDPTVGAEQEYFLISEKDYAKRQDLVMCGRTLFGYAPCKGQELEEHYFGAIRPTVNEFMKELDDELWELGVSAQARSTTRWPPPSTSWRPSSPTPTAPSTRTCSPWRRCACWPATTAWCACSTRSPSRASTARASTTTGRSPPARRTCSTRARRPMDNLRFLVFLTGVIQAVDDYQELLRMSVASAGNDHRLGANEAPPGHRVHLPGRRAGRHRGRASSDEQRVHRARRRWPWTWAWPCCRTS